jgi:broad specificity phosphatase PhoE
MPKFVELRRHTDSDGDFLTAEGVQAALEIGFGLPEGYTVMVSSGAQRATQTIACFLAAGSAGVSDGVVVDARFRSENEDRWRAAYERAGAGDIEAFRRADPDLVEKESGLFARAVVDLFERLPDGGRALVVGHSPMQEAAAWRLTGAAVEPLGKGDGVVVVRADDGSYRLE